STSRCGTHSEFIMADSYSKLYYRLKDLASKKYRKTILKYCP
ncbi:MAG: hypothetical protein ACI9YB_002582, partial [Halioglobus sp.]